MHLKTFQRRQIKQSTPQSGLKPPRPFTMQSPALEIGAANHRDAHAGSALKDHRSSLPDKIKAGIERLSGISLEDVQVHYNSARPAQFRALACTQGTQIHIGPGQERHLAHEAWHVVQQKQGRVKSKAKEQGAGINEDSTLEREADALGLHAMLGTVSSQRTVSLPAKLADTGSAHSPRGVIQMARGKRPDERMLQARERLRKKFNKETGQLTTGQQQEREAQEVLHAQQMREAQEVLRAQQMRQALAQQAQMQQPRRQQLQLQLPQRQLELALPEQEHKHEHKQEHKEKTSEEVIKDYNVSPQDSVEKRLDKRKQLIKQMGLSKELFPASAKFNSDQWHGGKEDLIGSHHKFPKRTLGYLFHHMTDEQQNSLRAKLFLDKNAKAGALARLRSNLIPPGPHNVSPDIRRDDPEHTGEMLDLVTDESGSLTPRSRSYANLSLLSSKVAQRLGQSEGTLTNPEAHQVTSHLREAEEWHQAIEGSTHKAADYGKGFWQDTEGSEARKYIKGVAPKAKYTNKQKDSQAYEQAQKERLEEESRKASEARAKVSEKNYVYRHWGLGKSARFY